MTEGTIVAAERDIPETRGAGGEHPTWNGAAAARAIEESVQSGLLKPCRALLLGADMSEEAAALSRLGFQVMATDPSGEALARLRKAVEAKGGKIDAVRAEFLKTRQYYYGPVGLLVERTMLPGIPASGRAQWACVAARCLSKDGKLFALFRVGRGITGPPFVMSADATRKMLSRLFLLETFAQVGHAGPGRDQAWMGVFRRK